MNDGLYLLDNHNSSTNPWEVRGKKESNLVNPKVVSHQCPPILKAPNHVLPSCTGIVGWGCHQVRLCGAYRTALCL